MNRRSALTTVAGAAIAATSAGASGSVAASQEFWSNPSLEGNFL